MTEATSLIEIPGKLDGKDFIFKFRKMSVDQAASYIAIGKGVLTLYEAINKKIESMDKIPVEDRNVDAYIKLHEKHGQILGRLIKHGGRTLDFLESPNREDFQNFMQKDEDEAARITSEFTAQVLVTEEDRKN